MARGGWKPMQFVAQTFAFVRRLFPPLPLPGPSAALSATLLTAGCAMSLPATQPAMQPGIPPDPTDPDAIVACYESERDLVTRLPAALCRGEIVDEREAARLEAARNLRVQAAARQFGVGSATENRRLSGSGTGILVSQNGGEILTNFHVVRSCAVISVTAADGTNTPARLRAKDGERDLALLSSGLTDEGRTVAAFNADPASASPFRLAVIGFPLQGVPTILSSLTPAIARPQDLASQSPQFLVGGSVEPGHSGSPLVDQSGNVVGLVKAKIDSVAFYRKTGQIVDDIGLAISNPAIFEFLEAHDVSFRVEPSGPPLSDEDILATARQFVVRVNCWR